MTELKKDNTNKKKRFYLDWSKNDNRSKSQRYFDNFIWIVTLIAICIFVYKYGFGFTNVHIYMCDGTDIGGGKLRTDVFNQQIMVNLNRTNYELTKDMNGINITIKGMKTNG